MDVFWEISDPDATKWSGISFVFDLLDVDPARAVGLGDGENDVVWMREIGLPVAMGNARPEARAVARVVTGHHAHEGAADFLDEVLRQLRQRAGLRRAGTSMTDTSPTATGSPAPRRAASSGRPPLGSRSSRSPCSTRH